MSCDHECVANDDHELKLTKEYKYLLSYIRPLIDQLEKSRDVQLCLLWLSKLEQSAAWEKGYRNKILSQLCKQVKSNCLKPPFNSSPPNGPLRNIVFGVNTCFDNLFQTLLKPGEKISLVNSPKLRNKNKSCKRIPDRKTINCANNECSEVDASTEEAFSSSSHHSFAPLKAVNKHQTPAGVWRGGYNTRSKGGKPCKEVLDHSKCFAIQNAYHERAQSDQVVIEKYQEIIKSLVSQQLKGDISPHKIKKLQSSYEVKVMELVQSLKKEQEENGILKRKIHCLEGNLKNFDVLKNENETLKNRLLELESENTCLSAKCQQAEEEKMRALSDVINKLNESEKKLKDSEKRFKSLEKVYEDNYCSFETECQAKASEREKQYLMQLSTLEKLLEEKQSEISGLKEQIKIQSDQFEEKITLLQQKLEETPNVEKEKEKVKNLKIKAKKLEKVREHMTVLFQSQLQQILAKKDFYIASLEMQLKMNNSESGGNGLSSDLNDSFDQRISNLEAQYRKLLEDSEQQSIKRRHLDLQKIHTLQKQLLSFGQIIVDNETKSEESKVILLPPESSCEVNTNCGNTNA